MDHPSLGVGHHRPVYFWAGPDTVRMNRLKFMDQPVNQDVHLQAHTPQAAHRLAEAGFNWAYLMYNWGFPPDEDQAQRESFHQAVECFHQAGIRVLGYVQLSNCAYTGAYKERDWYAVDPWGNPIYYYTGRYMICWHHPQWRDQLRERVRGVLEAGADGVFLDNPWMGLHALSLAGTWVTGAGCYCDRCYTAYAEVADGAPIPRRLDPSDPGTRHYLAWRVDVVWDLVDELARYAHSLRPEALVVENVYDAINRNHFADFGVDLRRAAQVSDLVMIEDHSLPRLVSEDVLINNAITCKGAQAWSGSTPVTTDPYIEGIGFDPVYTPRQFRRAVAEGAACGTATVVKGTEFFDARDGGFTLLTGEPFAAERRALGRIHRWLEGHADLYQDRREASPLAIYFPYVTLPFDWRYAAPITFAACQALLVEGVPFRIVGPGEWDDVEVLVVPPARDGGLAQRLSDFVAAGGRAVALGEARPGAQLAWARARSGPSLLQRHDALRAAVGRVAMLLFRSYFTSRTVRRLLDGMGITQRVLQGSAEGNPLYAVPPAGERAALLDAIDPPPLPRATAPRPVLIEWWRKDGVDQLHLVNYDDAPQEVSVELPWRVRARALSPDREEVPALEGARFQLPLDVYTVLLCERL